MARFGPPPPFATSFFIGDQLGGSGWNIELPDGSASKYYVELPIDIGKVSLNFPKPPNTHRGKEIKNKSIESMAELYLNYLKELLENAKRTFEH